MVQPVSFWILTNASLFHWELDRSKNSLTRARSPLEPWSPQAAATGGTNVLDMLTAGILVFRLCLWKWPKYNSPISLRAEWFRSQLNTFPLQECKAAKCHTSALKAGWWIGNRVATAAVSPGFSGVVTHSQTFSPLKKKTSNLSSSELCQSCRFYLQKVSPSRGLSPTYHLWVSDTEG